MSYFLLHLSILSFLCTPPPPPPLLLSSLQLQKRKEREEQLEDVIQAYEKIHMEKSNLQRDLDKMVRNILFTSLHCAFVTFTVALHINHMACLLICKQFLTQLMERWI